VTFSKVITKKNNTFYPVAVDVRQTPEEVAAYLEKQCPHVWREAKNVHQAYVPTEDKSESWD
jgi:hypothetical protein